ncbi:MAG: 50S ribosomal protein L11 methyltransferase [Verrucomicrobiota bacterium]
MKKIPLWQIAATVHPEAEEAAVELLSALAGQQASVYTDAETGVPTISVFLVRRRPELPAALRRELRRLRSCGLQTRPARIVERRLKPQNWADSWKRHFHPLEIGRRLLVRPGWIRRRAAKGRAVVVLDPGLSFGTGHHPTTSFCLSEIARARRGPGSFLDIGTGSGILAIAAAKLGFQPVEAFDFDPDCVRTTVGNSRRNRVEGKVRCRRADVTRLPLRPKKTFDLVCANLISPLLISECRRISAQVKPGGRLVLAGILAKEFDAVERVYRRAGFRRVRARTQREWRSGVFRRKVT